MLHLIEDVVAVVAGDAFLTLIGLAFEQHVREQWRADKAEEADPTWCLDPHTSDSETLRRWAAERDTVNARLLREWAEQRRQARSQVLRDALRAIAFFLVSAAIAATVVGVIDNAGRGGDPHGREIIWWLTAYGVCCGGAAYGLFSDYFRPLPSEPPR